MKHDDIVLSLTKAKLALLLSPQFGEKGSWSTHHWVNQKELNDWTKEEKDSFLESFNAKVREINRARTSYKDKLDIPFRNYSDLKNLKEGTKMAHDLVMKVPKEKSLVIEKNVEYPIIKGQGQYKITKGFVDLIVHCYPFKFCEFASYQNIRYNELMEFIIEIKKEEDFKDFGSVLRQIKEYKEYYETEGVKKWTSKIINNKYDGWRSEVRMETIYCILSTKIPEGIKELFADEGILCLELDSLNQTQK